jgi:hypothetical protein
LPIGDDPRSAILQQHGKLLILHSARRAPRRSRHSSMITPRSLSDFAAVE